jgi:hypothetical protein
MADVRNKKFVGVDGRLIFTTGKGGARIKKGIRGKRWSSKFVLSRDEIDKERR